MMTPAQLNASQKAQVGQWFEMADKALDETGKWMDLHLNVCRQTVEDMAHCCQSACDVKDLPGVFLWQTLAFKPFAERSAEYGARLMGLASGSGLDFGRSFEAQWETMGRQMNQWMGQGLGSLPKAQGESVDYMRQAMQAFDSVWDAMRQNMSQVQQMSPVRPHVQATPAKGVPSRIRH